jgi:hypothetical protein
LSPFHAYDEGNLSWLVIVCFPLFSLHIRSFLSVEV